MSSVEILSGDFVAGSARIRYSPAGRAYLRVTSRDGFVEDLFFETDLAACYDSTDGEVGGILRRWADENGISESGRQVTSMRGERVFAALLRDGRRLIGRASLDTLSEMKGAVRGEAPPPAPPPPATVAARSGLSGLMTRLFQARH